MFAILKKTGVPDDSDQGMQDIADLSGQEEEMMTAAATSSNRGRDIGLLIPTATNVSPAGVPWGAYSWFKDIQCQPQSGTISGALERNLGHLMTWQRDCRRYDA